MSIEELLGHEAVFTLSNGNVWVGTVDHVTVEYVVLTNAAPLDAPRALQQHWNIALAHIVTCEKR